MVYLAKITRYPYVIHSEELPFKNENGDTLTIDFKRDYSALFFGKIPYSPIGKKYAVIHNQTKGEALTIDDWKPKYKTYFEQNKARYDLPKSHRFGWIPVWFITVSFVVLLFVGLFVYLFNANGFHSDSYQNKARQNPEVGMVLAASNRLDYQHPTTTFFKLEKISGDTLWLKPYRKIIQQTQQFNPHAKGTDFYEMKYNDNLFSNELIPFSQASLKRGSAMKSYDAKEKIYEQFQVNFVKNK